MIRVTCAIICNEESEVLAVQRGEKTDHPYKWEFPGGKIKAGESEEECLIREVREELSLDIVICGRMQVVEYDYGIKQIVLIPFVCDTLDSLPVLSEHVAFKWLMPQELLAVDFSEADIIVAGNYLKSLQLAGKRNNCDHEEESHATNEAEFQKMIASIRGTREAEFYAASASENPEILRRLIKYSYSEDQKLAFHASWALTKTCDKCPEVIIPFLSELVDSLGRIENQSVERSFLRAASLADLTELDQRRQGMLADHCFESLRSGFSAIAIKAYSMEILYKLALIYPDLTKELTDTIYLLRGEGSAGIIAKGKMVIKKLERNLRDQGSSRS